LPTWTGRGFNKPPLRKHKRYLPFFMNDTLDIKRKYFDSLKRGTGEAYLIAKDNPKIDFSNYIVKGALRNYSYDGQSENSRAQYIFDLILLSDKKEKIRKAILKGLETEQSDTWSLTHLFDLVKLYAKQGDNEARQAIKDRFLNHSIEHADWVGYEAILELDGLQGLIFIAEKFGRRIDKNPNDWQDNHIINYFQSNNPKIKVKRKLENEAKRNKFIKTYLDNIKKTEENWKRREPKPTFKDIIDEVLKSKPFLSYRRRKELTKTELRKIAESLVVEKNKANQEKLLDIFTSHKFPLDSKFILDLAEQKMTSKNRINEYAIDALKFLQSESVRTFALTKIRKAKQPQPFIDILTSNYKKGDFKLLRDIAKKAKNEHVIERLAGSYLDIFKANKTKECKEPLEILYSKMNCGIHRNGLIEVLIENKVLSDRLKKEIQYDCYLGTRELILRKKNGR